MRRVRVVGPGRAGGALALALERAGWPAPELVGRDGDVAGAAAGVELVLIATPDRVVADVAAAIEPVDATVVAHVAGSLGLDVLASHARPAALHPLVAMPDPRTGADRLVGAWFAVAGDALVEEVVVALHGHRFTVADADRARYHAAAVVASNHLVALLGQAARIAATAGVPFEALLGLVRATVDNVAELGPARALTGPAARGDEATIRRHLAALPADDRPAYEALVVEARRLASEATAPLHREHD